MQVRETSINKDSGFSTDFFHTLIKQRQILERSNSRGELFEQQLDRFSHQRRSHLRVIGHKFDRPQQPPKLQLLPDRRSKVTEIDESKQKLLLAVIRVIETLATGVAAAGSLLALGGLGLELNYRRTGSPNKLELTAGEWHLAISEPNRYLLVGEMEFRNLTQRFEIMLPEVRAQVKLLSDGSLDGVTSQTKVIPCHKEAAARTDDYWFGYIVKAQKNTKIKVSVDIQGQDLTKLQSAWVQVHFVTYCPAGASPKSVT